VSFAHLEPVVRAVLYEGYILYPYRASSVKNQYRWTFGGLCPRAWSEANPDDPWQARAETLLVGTARSALDVSVRFLQLVDRPAAPSAPGWQEAVERRVDLPKRAVGEHLGRPVVRRFTFDELSGELAVAATEVQAGVFRVSVSVQNHTGLGESALPPLSRASVMTRSFASVHALLGVQSGEFVSLVDPPAELHAAADACQNLGMWPVLAGEGGRRDVVLASPIILGDHPRLASESPGDLFDGTEIDEVLTLRILTMTDAEKAEMRAVDPRARALLERVETLGPDALVALHGVWRPPSDDGVGPGARVRLRPRAGGDIFDLALTGRAATVASVERDFEGRVFVAVTVDDDPGADLGLLGQPGHRFFFAMDELERLS
jgi:hypothetical protein